MIAFSESQESLCTWQAVVEQVGLADLAVSAWAGPVRRCAFISRRAQNHGSHLGYVDQKRAGWDRVWVVGAFVGCPCRTSLAIAANMEGTRVGMCAARY